MSRRRLSPATVRQVIVTMLVFVAIVVAVGLVRRAAPERPLDTGIDPALAPDDPAANYATCERTLPEATTATSSAERPLGRVTSSEVYECPDAFDQQTVIYIGEAVGDVLLRDGGAWVLVNDDAYALQVGPLQGHRQFGGSNSGLSVWLPDGLVDLVQRPGGPGVRGDVLRLRGVIYRADPDDGGGLTLRATTGRRLADAVDIEQGVNGPQALLAVMIVGIAAALSWAERRTAQRR